MRATVIIFIWLAVVHSKIPVYEQELAKWKKQFMCVLCGEILVRKQTKTRPVIFNQHDSDATVREFLKAAEPARNEQGTRQ